MSTLDGKLYQDTPLGEWFQGKNGALNQSLVFRKGMHDRKLVSASVHKPNR